MQDQQGRLKNSVHYVKKSHFCLVKLPQILPLKTNWCCLPLTCFLLMGLFACGRPTPTEKETNNTEVSPQPSSTLTFFDITLEQADEVGQPLWQVQAKKATYTQEKQIAHLETPVGELYQDGKLVYQIQSKRADIKQDGKQLFLKGQIVAKDPENGITLKGNELEWRPQENLLIVRNQLNGTHKQVQAKAQEVKVFTREQRLQFTGGVVANSTDPAVRIRTEELIWQVSQEKLIAQRPIVDRYHQNQITDSGRGDTAELNLKTKIVNIKKNAEINLLQPPTQIVSDSVIWDMNTENITSNSPVRIVQRQENITVTANQGKMKTADKVITLTGNVNAVGQRQQSLKSDQLTWHLNKKLLLANGNIIYTQLEPKLNFRGQTAVGNLETENIVVKGDLSGKRVVTQIVPPAYVPKN